jgi:quercetin dioxygenase-like cupin family protein
MAEAPRVVWMPGGVRTEVHLASEDTDGAFCLLVDHPPAGWSLPPHRHHNEAETIHVVDGEFEIEIDGDRMRLSAGQTVHVPRGATHAGANVGDRPGRRVVMFSPGGLERFFLEAGAVAPDTKTELAAVLAAADRHGWEFVAASEGLR